LVEFTRDFPDWGLADIFIFLKTGQPKKDFTPSRRSNRPLLKNINIDSDKRSISGEQEKELVDLCSEEIRNLLELDEIVDGKVRLMLKKNEMKPERVLGTVKKNLPFYKRFFSIRR